MSDPAKSRIYMLIVITLTIILLVYHINVQHRRSVVEQSRIQVIQDLLNSRLDDRWRRDEAKKILEALLKANPNIKTPPELEKLLKPEIEPPIILGRDT